MRFSLQRTVWISVILLAGVFVSYTFPQAELSVEKTSAEELLKIAEDLLKEVSELRALPIKHPVKKGVKTKEEIRKYVLRRLREDHPAKELLAEQKALVKLGLIPKDLKLEKVLVDLYTEQIAGYYDAGEKIFFIADWIPLVLQKPTMVHELTHALQDQHYNLESFFRKVKNNDDFTLARLALVEGDGFAVMLDYMLKPQGLSFVSLPNLDVLMKSQLGMLTDFAVFSSAPEYLKQTLMFPYSYGTAFLQAARKKLSWNQMSRLYADPPKSTEQILHPEKYLDKRDDPIAVEIGVSSEPLKGWKEIYANVLGEFDYYLLIKEIARNEEKAKAAAEGWGGSKFKLYEQPTTGKLLLINSSAWDTETDAKKFFNAYKEVIEKKYKQARIVESKEGKSYTWETEEDLAFMELSKTRILIIEGAPKDLLATLRKR